MFIFFEPLKVTTDVFVPVLSTPDKSCCSYFVVWYSGIFCCLSSRHSIRRC